MRLYPPKPKQTPQPYIARCAQCGAQDWGPKIGSKGQTYHCLPCAELRVKAHVLTPRVRLRHSPLEEPVQGSLLPAAASSPYDHD